MPRTRRADVGETCYHVINRGNRRELVFHDESDYDSFDRLMADACERVPMRVLAHSLMPNHVHFVLWTHSSGDMGRWMHWLFTKHVRWHHARHGTDGRLWQGRFKAFPCQQDAHLLTVLRYVERNALRANLVGRAQDWQWTSARPEERRQDHAFLSDWPIARPPYWLDLVNEPQTEAELTALRQCVNRGRPWGEADWVAATVERLGLQSTMRAVGRPRAQPLRASVTAG